MKQLFGLMLLAVLLTACAAPDSLSAVAIAPITHATQTSFPTPSTAPTPTPSATPSATPNPPSSPPPTLDTTFTYYGLVNLAVLDPTFVVDLRYATDNNFTGTAHYEIVLPLAHKDMAKMLLEAQAYFAKDGYALKLYDTYRPLPVQKQLYDATPAALKRFVAKPSKNALHCKGLAVDCTLVTADGEELPMPSAYDEFTERASVQYTGGTKEERDNRDYLIAGMKQCGFSVYSKEWWHFTAPNPSEYPLLSISLTEFAAQAAAD